MADFVYPPLTPAPNPAPISPEVPLNPPMVGTASPFDHVDGQNRDLILESIRTWIRVNLRHWSTEWQEQLVAYLAETTAWLNGFDAAVTEYVTSSIAGVAAEVGEQLDDQQAEFTALSASLVAQVNATLASVTGTYVSIYSFVQPGETFKINGTGPGDTANNTTIIQRAVNAINALWLVDALPRKILFPDGNIFCAKGGGDGAGNPTNWCVQWKSGVGIGTSSETGVRFVPAADCTMFAADGVRGNLERVYCDSHVIDGYLQYRATYTSKLKGWFIQGLNHSAGVVHMRNIFASGWGCDYLRDTQWTIYGENCGRGLKDLGVDPLTTSGGSTCGIGTGRFEVEDFDVVVYSKGAGFHGAFTEYQPGEPYALTRGGRIRVYSQDDFIAFRDCGSDGLISDVTALGSKYAAVLHTGTILAPTAGKNGRMAIHASKGCRRGLQFGNFANAGPYTFTGEIGECLQQAVYGTLTANLAGNIDLLFDKIYNNGSQGIQIQSSTTNLRISRTKFFGNVGNDISLNKAQATATGLEVTDNDFRERGMYIAQATATVLIDRNRGNANASPITQVLDTFSRADGSLTPSVTEVGAEPWQDSNNAWEIVAGDLSLKSGLVSNTEYYASLYVESDNAVVRGVVGTVNPTATDRRLRLAGRIKDADNLVTWGLSNTSGQLILAQRSGGVSTSLATYTYTPVADDVLELRITGSTASGYLNGAVVATATTAALAAGRWGTRCTGTDPLSSYKEISVTPL